MEKALFSISVSQIMEGTMKFMTGLTGVNAFILAFGINFLSGCCTTDQQGEANKALREIAKDLNEVENDVNTWGCVTVSDLVLTEAGDQFKINYEQSVTNYVERARSQIQGTVRNAIQRGFYAGLEASASIESPVSIGRAPTVTNVNSSIELPGILPDQARKTLASNQFATPQDLSTQEAVLSERQAHLIAFNDKIAETIFKTLSHPTNLPAGTKLMFGVVQVTCNPGIETRQGYIADVHGTIRHAKYVEKKDSEEKTSPAMQRAFRIPSGSASQGANKEFFVDLEAGPRVFAVLPLLDAVSLDLRNSQRSQVEFALGIAAALEAQGLGASAKLLTDWVKRQEADVRTRNSVPVITSYADGRGFGFRIFPSLEAVSDRTIKNSRAQEVLRSTVFPAVVAVLVDTKEVQGNKTEKEPEWSHYFVSVSSRWIPTKMKATRLAPSDKAQHAAILDKVRKKLKETHNNQVGNATRNEIINSLLYNEVLRSYHSLSVEALGFNQPHKFPNLFPEPDTKTPSILKVIPEVVGLETQKLIISGKNLSSIKQVMLGGLMCNDIEKHEKFIKVTIPSAVRKNGSKQTLVLNNDEMAIPCPNPIEVVAEPNPTPPSIFFQRNPDGKVSEIKFTGNSEKLSEAERLKAATEILKTSEAPPPTKEKN
jgi:hypothetical protein